MTAKLKTQACGTCNGVGVVPADDVGPVLRTEREKAGVTRSALAEAIGISASYLRDLEEGYKRWSNEMLESYQRWLRELAGEGNGKV